MRIPEPRGGGRRWAAAVALVVVLAALVPVGRWEAHRHARAELAGIRTVLAAIGPLDRAKPDAFRRGVGPHLDLDCLLYRRGANPFALEICWDRSGRVVEGYDRRGSSPRIWSIREDPSASTIRIDRAPLERRIDTLAHTP